MRTKATPATRDEMLNERTQQSITAVDVDRPNDSKSDQQATMIEMEGPLGSGYRMSGSSKRRVR
jgi:hypothetical protein